MPSSSATSSPSGGAKRWRRQLLALMTRHSVRNSEPVLTVLCAPLGAFVGLVVVILHGAVSWLHTVDFSLSEGAYLSAGAGIDPHRLILVPAVGGLLVGLVVLLRRRLRQRDAVDPIEANALHGGRMSLKDSLRLTFTTMISNAAGASVGMEAAYTQTGAGLLSAIGQALKLRRPDLRVFVAAGSAAAIAAAFNAPLAGAFYAYELVLGSYSPAALAQVAFASLSGALVMRATVSVEPIYVLQATPLVVPHWEYPVFVLLGVLAAGIGILTMKLVTWSESTLRRLPLPTWSHAAVGGALLSAIALRFPQVLGSGHGGIQILFENTPELKLLIGLLVAKVLASAISIGSGFRGGLFSSSLFIGCLFGAVFATALAPLVPWNAGHTTVFMLVGMGAVAASIVGAPLTMVLLVLEVTGDFQVAMGVLAGVVTSATITRYGFGYSFSTWRFHQRGKSIRGAHDIGWISDLSVARMMRGDPKTVTEEMPLLRLRQRFPLGSATRVFVLDGEGHYAGVVETTTLHDAELDDAAAGLVASDLAANRNVFLLPDQNVQAALIRFAEAEMEALPVLASTADRRLVGYLTEAYALRRYTEELERQRNAELGEPGLFSLRPPAK